MKLKVATVPYALPVSDYAASSDTTAGSVRLLMPANDPKSIGLVPGLEAELIHDDGRSEHLRIGKKWTFDAETGNMQIEVLGTTPAGGGQRT